MAAFHTYAGRFWLGLILAGSAACSSSGADRAATESPAQIPRQVVAGIGGTHLSQADWENLPVRYQVQARPGVGDLRIELRFNVPPDHIELRLPRRSQTIPGGNAVRGLEATCDDTKLTVESGVSGVMALGNVGCREVRASYFVTIRGAHGSPSAGNMRDDLFRLHGPAAFVTPGTRNGDSFGRIGVTVLSKGTWSVTSNWTPVHVLDTAGVEPLAAPGRVAWHFLADDVGHLEDSLVVGGDLKVHTAQLSDGRTAQLTLTPGASVAAEDLEQMVDRIVVAQRDYLPAGWQWPASTKRLSVVVLNSPVPKRVAGGGHRGGFMVEVGPGVAHRDLAELVAHETFHVLNGHLLVHEPAAEYRTLWFKEGVTSYVAARTVVRAGLADETWFRHRIARLIGNYLGNPQAMKLSARNLEHRFWRDPHARRLPYDKGALIGLLLDLQLSREQAGSGLARWFSNLLSDVALQGQPYDAQLLQSSLLVALPADAREKWGADFWRRYVEGVELLPLRTALAGADLHLVRGTETAPYWGLQVSMDAGGVFVSNLDRGGPAEASGLRLGDRLSSDPTVGGMPPAGSVQVDVIRAGIPTPFAIRPVASRREVYRLHPLAREGAPRYLRLLVGGQR